MLSFHFRHSSTLQPTKRPPASQSSSLFSRINPSRRQVRRAPTGALDKDPPPPPSGATDTILGVTSWILPSRLSMVRPNPAALILQMKVVSPKFLSTWPEFISFGSSLLAERVAPRRGQSGLPRYRVEQEKQIEVSRKLT